VVIPLANFAWEHQREVGIHEEAEYVRMQYSSRLFVAASWLSSREEGAGRGFGRDGKELDGR
jgi:hypothetical protein